MVFIIFSFVFVFGIIEIEVFVVKDFFVIIDGDNCFVVNWFVFLFFVINVFLIFVIFVLLDLKIFVMLGFVILFKLDWVFFCLFLEFIY